MQQDAPIHETEAGGASAGGSPDAAYARRCRQALEVALERTPMYAAWRGRDPGPAQGIEARYRALPVLTKADIRTNAPYGVVPRGMDLDDALRRGEVSFVRTSGTEDEALQNIWNQSWWDASEHASWTLNAVAAANATGCHREAILASALSVGPRSGGGPIDRESRMLGRFLFLNEYGLTSEWPDGHERRILGELRDYQPPVLEASPSLLARVARWAWRTGADAWQPALITLTYEFPSALQLRDIRRVFHSALASSYGSTEAGYVFMECERGRLHQNVQTCRVDLLPVDSRPGGSSPADPGLGRIVATTFGNEWFPLLRFDIGDVGRRAAEPCPCGRTAGLTLRSIEGRCKSLCVAGDGTVVTHGAVDRALAAVPGLEQYRIDQESPRQVRCRVIPEPAAGARVPPEARGALAEVFGSGVEVDVVTVPVLHPEKSGKFLLALRWFPLEQARHA